MIIGFGSTETKLESEIEREIENYVKSKYAEKGLDYYTDEFKQEMEGWIKDLALKSQEEAEVNKTVENFPDRYTYFYVYVVGDCNYLCFIISFSHINRRHAFSPDGWALLRTKKTVTVGSN